MPKQTISNQVRNAVKASNIPQREVAKRAGVALNLIVRFLAGGNIGSDKQDQIIRVLPPELRAKIRG